MYIFGLNDIGLAEDLTIYMDLIRQIHKDGGSYEHRPTARSRFTHILGVRVMLIVENPTVIVKYRTAIKALFFTLICVLNVKWASFMFINIHILSY